MTPDAAIAEAKGIQELFSLDMIRRVLKDLRGKKVERLGRGQNAQWQKLAN
jgi:hypothetical protein